MGTTEPSGRMQVLNVGGDWGYVGVGVCQNMKWSVSSRFVLFALCNSYHKKTEWTMNRAKVFRGDRSDACNLFWGMHQKCAAQVAGQTEGWMDRYSGKQV